MSHQPRQLGWGCLCEPGWGSSSFCGFAALCKGALEGPRVGLRGGLGCPTVLDLGLSPYKAAITTSKGQPRDAPKVFGRRSVCNGQRQTLFGQINEL